MEDNVKITGWREGRGKSQRFFPDFLRHGEITRDKNSGGRGLNPRPFAWLTHGSDKLSQKCEDLLEILAANHGAGSSECFARSIVEKA